MYQIAMAGFTEVLTWILCSYKENFTMLKRKDDKKTAAINGNPRSADFEVGLPSGCNRKFGLHDHVAITVSKFFVFLFHSSMKYAPFSLNEEIIENDGDALALCIISIFETEVSYTRSCLEQVFGRI